MSSVETEDSGDDLLRSRFALSPSCFSNLFNQRSRTPSIGKSPDSLPRSPLLDRIKHIQNQQSLLESFTKEENAIHESLSVVPAMHASRVARHIGLASSHWAVRVQLL